MSKKTINAINELYIDNKEVGVTVFAIKGDKKYPYYNVKSEETLQKIIDYRIPLGYEVKIIN